MAAEKATAAAELAEANQAITNLRDRLETQQKSHQVLRLIESKVHEMIKKKLEAAQKQTRPRAATADAAAGPDGAQATTSTAGTQTEVEMGSAVATTQTEPTAPNTATADAAVMAAAGEGAPGAAGRSDRRRRWRKRKSGRRPGDLRVVRWAEPSASSDSEGNPGPQRRVVEVDI